MPKQIQKRDGCLETWSPDRIALAILKALKASGIKDPLLSRRLARKVEQRLEGIDVPCQEQVQDTIEMILMESRLYHVARRFIIYRENRRQLREQQAAYLDISETIDNYLDKADWRVNENANMTHSFQGLMLHLSGTLQARYSLEKYPEEVRQAHEHGYFHIHDLSFGLAGYCAGWSLRDLLLEGFNLEGRSSAGPAKHLDTALGQMNNFLGTLQNEWAGAQAFNNVDTYLAQGRPELPAGASGHTEICLQPEHNLALGRAKPLHQPELRPCVPAPYRQGSGHNRRHADRRHLCRIPDRNGHDQQGIS
jgi:ribonucleoside-triphosphate reductase